MADTVNDRFMDFQVAQQIRWIRLQNREAREALKILNRIDRELAVVLRDVDPSSTRFTDARLFALKTQVENLMRTLHQQIASEITSAVVGAAIESGEVEAELFARMLPAGLDITTPNPGVLQNAATTKPFNGAVLSDWTSGLVRADIDRTWRTIQDGIISGTTTDDLIRQLNGTRSLRYKDGIRQVSRRGLETLVRTSINHATNVGRQQMWEANADIIAGVRWVSTLDGRTTPICQMRDGKVGPVVDSPGWTPPNGAQPLDPPFARPPAHPNCRSTTTAVTKSWKELGFNVEDLPPETRASMDGKVPADLTYFQWLEKQSTSVQEDVLGPTRMKLWKEGGIAPDRFQNDLGRVYTLDELKRRRPQAFKEAGL